MQGSRPRPGKTINAEVRKDGRKGERLQRPTLRRTQRILMKSTVCFVVNTLLIDFYGAPLHSGGIIAQLSRGQPNRFSWLLYFTS